MLEKNIKIYDSSIYMIYFIGILRRSHEIKNIIVLKNCCTQYMHNIMPNTREGNELPHFVNTVAMIDCTVQFRMGHFCETLKSLLLLIVFAALSMCPRPSLDGA